MNFTTTQTHSNGKVIAITIRFTATNTEEIAICDHAPGKAILVDDVIVCKIIPEDQHVPSE